MNDLTHLDLFSGIGGFALAASWAGFRTVGFSEIEPYCCRVLEKNFPDAGNFGDIRTADFSAIGDVRLLTGGYPCQPFSSAGKRQGERDDRRLWPAMFDVIKKVRPAWVVAENVAGHISMGLDQVLSDLEGAGYSAQPIVIPACAVAAWHRRDRVWIICRSERSSLLGANRRGRIDMGGQILHEAIGKESTNEIGRSGSDGISSDALCGTGGAKSQLEQGQRTEVAASGRTINSNANGEGLQGRDSRELCEREEQRTSRTRSPQTFPDTGRDSAGRLSERQSEPRDDQRSVRSKETGNGEANPLIPNSGWIVESRLGGMVDGLSCGLDGHGGWATGTSIPPTSKSEGRASRVHRLKSLGNSIVPQVAYQILKAIAEIERSA